MSSHARSCFENNVTWIKPEKSSGLYCYDKIYHNVKYPLNHLTHITLLQDYLD
jgi:hypothetical protein